MKHSFACMIDLDGVLADFEGNFKRHFGVAPSEVEKSHGPQHMLTMVNSIPTFWTELPLMPGALDLWAAVAPYDPIVLSGCPRIGYSRAMAGKRKWVAQHLGPAVPVVCCLSKEKPLHIIGKGDILIDDRDYILKKWSKVGGIGILYESAPQAIAEFERIVQQKG